MLESLTTHGRPAALPVGADLGLLGAYPRCKPEVGLAGVCALGALLGSETGQVLLLTAPEQATAPLALPAALSSRPRLRLRRTADSSSRRAYHENRCIAG